MNRKQVAKYIEEALAGLKDFQRHTVDACYQRLFEENRKSMLVADEVGLGKTIVAKGIIARKLKRRLEEGRRKPYRVTYICSNQVISKENIQKLNPFPSWVQMKEPIRRIAFLAYDDDHHKPQGKEHQNRLELNSLTPATSFHIQNNPGTKRERAIIYWLLMEDPNIGKYSNGLSCLLKAGVRNIDKYREELKADLRLPLRGNLYRRFIRKLKKTSIPKSDKLIYEKLEGRRKRSLHGAVWEYASFLRKNNESYYHQACLYMIKKMRRILIHCCLDYVEADLYILDEFQRFSDLIDPDSEEEQALIARQIFFGGKKPGRRKDSRILMLSATPFKAFTGHDDMERGEDHYRDFRKVLSFLMMNDQENLQKYDKHRQALHKQILDLRRGELDLTPLHRRKVEEILCSVMCRTERTIVAEDPNIMIKDKWRKPVKLSRGDIENYRWTDQLVMALSRLQLSVSKPVEYCKSAVYPFSYLDRYKIKEALRKHKEKPELRRVLRKSKDAWLDLAAVNQYKLKIGERGKRSVSTNARLSMLVKEALGDKGAELLWVPPSLPYYSLEGSFANTGGFSKTLVFSAWVMVPRMIGTLLSYEVERRTVGNSKTREAQEKEKRRYFAPKSKRRHPVPQLRFTRKGRKRDAQVRNMSNFCLLYPSPSLAEIVDHVENVTRGKSLRELHNELSKQLRDLINRAGASKYVSQRGEPGKWYWAAPMLLDGKEPRNRKLVESWLYDDSLEKEAKFFKRTGKDGSVRHDHFLAFREYFRNLNKVKLGPLPRDLPQVLADMALGSPAILALRSLQRVFPDTNIEKHMVGAFDTADEFVNLFNKPESISAVRLGTPRKRYWQMVARYCANGCLQAVLDEYFHLLKDQQLDAQEAAKKLHSSINLKASVINVDSLRTFMSGEPRKMRCHYAVDFGSQKIETDEGEKRITNLREVFNSPFRPFVLATTSIGQEGLDFHSYCRRVVHWNLPSNPIDLEQREGRVNRYKGLVIRQQLANKYRSALANDSKDLSRDIWEKLFRLADNYERKSKGKCELIPYWHVETDGIKIERIIPLYPYSKDTAKLESILKTLVVYRLAFGQPRQAELVEHLLKRGFTEEELRKIKENLIVNLSPINN